MAPRILLRVFTFTGLAFVAGAVYLASQMVAFLRTAVSAPGTIAQNIWIERTGRHTSWSAHPQVRFHKSDGGTVVFQSHIGANPPSFNPNEPVTVLYDPRDPQHAYIDTFGELWTLPLVLLIFGVGFCAPEAGVKEWRRARARKEAWLQQNGRRVQADITDVALNMQLRVNGVHPYRIHCQWLDKATNQIHVFHSANIWYDPSKYIPGKTLEVWMDPAKPHRYSVQTPFLPKVV